MDKHKKEQILDIIKSFKINPSTELEELAQLHEELYKEFDKDLDESIQVTERLRPAFDFIKKFPTNPEVHVFIGDHYLRSDELKQAISYYLKALENHKIQPFINPVTLWTCYDGLGLCYGMSGEYEPSKQYFEKSYELAKDISEPYYIASSAYNLACLYAETNDMKNIFKYLAEAIQLNPESKEQAKQDPSFKNIKDNRQFKELLDGPPRTSTIFQKDADIVRLRHLKYYGELLERYHRITGKYPFQGQKDIPIYVHIANAEQIESTKQGPSYTHVVIPFKEFVKEIELVLGKEINEYYDPQYRPDYKPNFYIYMIDHDTYFFAVHVHQPYPFAKRVGEYYYKIELSNHPNPQNQAVSLEQLLNSSAFQIELDRTVSREGFFKEREDKFLHHTKSTY